MQSTQLPAHSVGEGSLITASPPLESVGPGSPIHEHALALEAALHLVEPGRQVAEAARLGVQDRKALLYACTGKL